MVMGRNGYGPKWSWAEMVMGRNDPESTHHTFISCFLHILGAGEKSSPQETKCSIGFIANIADMRIPFQIICNCYTKAGLKVVLLFPTFSYYSYLFALFLLFSYFFLKSSYYSYFFAVKCQNDDWSQEKPR